jgi:glycerol-3-phosphate O-acyltransferase 3/4
MIDFIILEQMTAFAVIMQKYPGWVGFLQTTVLESLGCIWFNRLESKDRLVVVQKLKKHVEDPDSNPLLVFPEGTCVNNEYTVMFKKGAFELDCTVCPIAIKYNKIFVDAFWNSKKYVFLLLLLYSALPPSKMLQWNHFKNNVWHILNIFGCAAGNHSPCI